MARATKNLSSHQIYRNLRNGKWSVQHRAGREVKVVAHADNVYMGVCSFVVQERGNQRVRLEQRKNVHAFVRGVLLDAPENLIADPASGGMVELTYNPYKYTSFVRKDTKQPVHNDPFVVLRADGSVWAVCPT